MIINKPSIEVRGGNTYLISLIKNEVTNIEEEFYYSVPNEYGEYLCHDNADAFVVAMLIPALMSGQDIKIKAPISEMLFYKLENSLIFLLSKVFDRDIIKVFPDTIENFIFSPNAIATGFSGGVDSFTTVVQHTSETCPKSLRLTHLTLFNVGAYGNDEKKSQIAFENDAIRAKKVSRIMSINLVLLNSNISKAYEVKEITHGNSPRAAMCIISGVLSLQKLFKLYLIASSNTVDKIKLDQWYQSSYESLVAYFLSTPNNHIIIANSDINKVEKLKQISGNKLVQNNIYVCASDILNEKSKIKLEKGFKPNCSECFKCLNTMVVLDILGCLEKYDNSFDLQKYRDRKTSYFRHLIRNANKDRMLKETYDLIAERNYKVPKEVLAQLRMKRLKDRLFLLKRKALRFVNFKLIKTPIKHLIKFFSSIFSLNSQKKNKFRITGSKI